jgi:GMP synthase (glutamine-hydrolysing)
MMNRILVIQHNLDDHLNELAGPLLAAGLEIETWDVENAPLHSGNIDGYAGVISLGAIAGVLEESQHAWMPVERRIMQQAVANGVPLLGICFGSQLLASVAGATITKTPTPEVGWTQVEMIAADQDDQVIAALGNRPEVFHFHYDTFDVPSSIELLGITKSVNQVFRVGAKAWGMQFHIEVGPAAMHSWFATYPSAFSKLGIDLDEQKAITAKNWLAHQAMSQRVAIAFANEVKAFASQSS